MDNNAREIYESFGGILTGVTTLFSIIGITANIVTIIAFIRHKNLCKNATTLFIINLCIIDLIYSSINLPMMAIFYQFKNWIFGNVLCKVYVMLYSLNAGASWLTIINVMINRYILICKPEIYGNIYSSLNVKIMLATVWTIPLIQASLPLTKIFGKIDQDPATLICTILPNNKDEIDPRSAYLVAGFIIPLFVITVTFLLIYKKVNYKDQNTTELSGNDTQSIQTNLSIIKIMLIIFIFHLVCYLPMPLLVIFKNQSPVLRTIFQIIYWTHVFTNPIIFFFTGKLYREAYRQKMFSFGKKKTSKP